MIEKIVLVVVGAILGGVGTLVMRWLRQDRVGEEIARRQGTARLIANMRRWGVSQGEIDAALASMDPRRPQQTPLTAEDRIEQQEYAAIERAQSQHEMNQAQWRRLERLEGRMNAALAELGSRLDAEMRELLARSQAAWEAYRDSMSDFAGAPWGDGSLRPFIEAGIRSHLTKQRAADLEGEVGAFKP
jgi:uncharacterized protein YecT (DUF1311 family)